MNLFIEYLFKVSSDRGASTLTQSFALFNCMYCWVAESLSRWAAGQQIAAAEATDILYSNSYKCIEDKKQLYMK